MNAQLQDIHDFHVKFQQAYNGPLRFLPEDILAFRLKFLREEIDEFEKAHAERNFKDMVDALVDLDYVLKGTVHLVGYEHQYARSWDIVHTKNMEKVLAENENQSFELTGRGYKFDVVKPPGWVKPDHSALVDEALALEQVG